MMHWAQNLKKQKNPGWTVVFNRGLGLATS